MYKMRNMALLKLSKGVMIPRLLSGSKNKGDSSKESCKDDGAKKSEKKKKKLDHCGRRKLNIFTYHLANPFFSHSAVVPTSPRCKNKPKGSDGKSGDDCKKN
ncbi:hypothetical protein KR084_005083 [Drosophila pseudotakahashii]|nr:hypothetical protein KR084_005083 [Drosophila pseudotakahashii]